MRKALAGTTEGSSWSSTTSDLHTAHVLAPWEPTFEWATGKAAIQALQNGSNPQAYADGTTALQATWRALPYDPGVVYDWAYLHLSDGIADHETNTIPNALNTFASLTALDPNNPTYWSGHGLAAAALGDYGEAEHDLSSALLLSPGNTEYERALQQVKAMAPSGQ